MERNRLDIIRGLLDKAERTTHPEEAKTFAAKAEELMAKWSIDEAMLDAKRVVKLDAIDVTDIWLPANEFRAPKVQLIQAVSTAHDCKLIMFKQRYICMDCMEPVIAKGRGHYGPAARGCTGRNDRRMFRVGVIGHASDREFVNVLFTSLLIQSERAFESGEVQSSMHFETGSNSKSGGHRIAWRNSFVMGYAIEVGDRFMRIKRKAQADAATAAPTGGVAIVLANRKTAVDLAFAKMFPRTTTTRSSAGNAQGSGFGLGMEAGSKADLGAPRAGGAKAIGG